MRIILSGCLLFLSYCSFSQPGKTFLDLSRYSCSAGDTVWFTGYISPGTSQSSLSTNLYVDTYTETGKLVSRNMFPVFSGISVGQVIFPDFLSTGNYYITAFTKEQIDSDTASDFHVPILVYNKAKQGPARRKKRILSPPSFTAGTIRNITWITSLYKGQLSSMVAIDSGSQERNLQEKLLRGDSLLVSDVSLNNHSPQQYSLFPLDTNRASEILFLYENNTLIGRQFIYTGKQPEPIRISPDTLSVSPDGYNSWKISIPDSIVYYSSVSVTDADHSMLSPFAAEGPMESFTEDLTAPDSSADKSYISYTGKANRASENITIAGVKDSNYIFTKLVHTDASGNFVLDSLFFFGNMDIQFPKNVQLNLHKYIPPLSDTSSFAADWQDDTTVADKKELIFFDSSKIKSLKAVTVRAWKNPRQELDHNYTSDAFSEPALYSFDIRTEKKYHDIGSYLRANFSRFQGGYSPSDTPKDVMGHPFLFYVDEQNYTWPELQMFDWERIAYIKCFENDFIGDDDFVRFKNNMPHGFSLEAAGKTGLKLPVSKTPVIVAIYTRKGKDFRTMPGGGNSITIKGYSEILKFTPDHTTLYWNPLSAGNNFRIRFTNNEDTRRFRLRVTGMNARGEFVYYEGIVGK